MSQWFFLFLFFFFSYSLVIAHSTPPASILAVRHISAGSLQLLLVSSPHPARRRSTAPSSSDPNPSPPQTS
ncbi:hypothetical protein PCANC_17305 [Puccinia coronata f. sp. avenae]|uniref:Secreted protein n=1 Tax=Puccinia coronata f. sp. avenae TaxID=200324 RepID=A0A2N5UIF6_9BASI|nr:hypothetical protein PCANC_17305 [Puccinia coronata f. sp. avenae]